MKRALVTGAGGYIGSHLCRTLRNAGWHVTGIDLSHKRRSMIGGVDSGIEIDILDHRLASSLAERNVDVVFHLAALIDVAEGEAQPLLYYRNNAVGTLNVVEHFQRRGTPIVLSSTAAVYRPSRLPLRETEPTAPQSVYGRSKLQAEEYVRASGLPHAILRYFNVAGCADGLRDNHDKVTHLIPRILKDPTGVVVNGNNYKTPDGTCVRDYVHVQDIADAHVKAAERLLEGHDGFVCNLGSGRGYSVLDVIQTARETIGEITYSVADRRPGDPDVLVADISRARDLLGFRPRYSLAEIISSHRF